MDYTEKYLKYKTKYLELKQQGGDGTYTIKYITKDKVKETYQMYSGFAKGTATYISELIANKNNPNLYTILTTGIKKPLSKELIMLSLSKIETDSLVQNDLDKKYLDKLTYNYYSIRKHGKDTSDVIKEVKIFDLDIYKFIIYVYENLTQIRQNEDLITDKFKIKCSDL